MEITSALIYIVELLNTQTASCKQPVYQPNAQSKSHHFQSVPIEATMEKNQGTAASCFLQEQDCYNPNATPKSAIQSTQNIQIQSAKCGKYPLTTVDGLSSLTNTFYAILKRRLKCPGKCANNKIELWNASARDVVQILVACGFPEEWITVHEL